MASGSVDENTHNTVLWRLLGPVTELSKKQCRLVYSALGFNSDVCLIFIKGEFFAMDARCAHAGGPICQGDIEEADGILQVFCPWHDYDFNIRTGKSQTGLQQEVYEVKIEEERVYVKHASPLSLLPFPQNPKS
ncbi:hypothetical protein SKAU_G00051470 [Synaphobranchus kaupii]|uniref:Rieske domain-containing protein n=1 Tax=Synaphobranchus kaupii TaxID=118154 RepID=A0A9Q1J9U4_SYNKA|nr:hypothetical protein SKAU_G00051470 [Synaphobranchus kaupii]